MKGLILSLVAGLVGIATATPSWTTGSCAPADWQQLDGNVLLNVKGTSSAIGVSGYASLDLAVLTDGKVPTATPDKAGIFGFRVNESVAWTFDAPVNLDQIRISSCYLTDAAYDGVHVAKVEVQPFGGSDWVKIAEETEYKGESAAGKINFAVLGNGGDPVAQSVSGLRVTFGSCETGYANYYAEIEAVGRAETTKDPIWKAESRLPAEWQPLEDNVLLNVKGTSAAQGVSGYASTDLAVLTDGKVPTAAPDKDGIFGFRVNESVSWSLAVPKTLEQIRISSCYLTDAAYDGVHVAKVEVQPFGESYWVQVAGEYEYKGESTSGKVNSIVLSNGDEPVAQSVVGLRVTFGSCETGFANYYAEIEAVGHTASTGPVLGSLSVVPMRTKAWLSSSIVDPGSDATACDVYLALGDAEAVKIAEGVTGPFEHQVQGLAAGTTYAYEIIVSNNAPVAAGVTKSGAFTTLAADAPTAAWATGSCLPSDWRPLENNVLADVKGTMLNQQPNGYGSKDLGVLTDGGVPSEAGKDWIVGVQPTSEIDWVFAEPVTLERLRISSAYLADPHYSGVNVSSVKVKCVGSDEWVEVPGSSSGKVAGDGSAKIVCATLSDAESGFLAQDVTALRVVFGAAVYNNANYYAEIEAVGHVNSGEPSSIPGVVFTVE